MQCVLIAKNFFKQTLLRENKQVSLNLDDDDQNTLYVIIHKSEVLTIIFQCNRKQWIAYWTFGKEMIDPVF